MKLEIDPDNLRTCMQLWKDSLSHAIPMATEFQLHFIQERPAILQNYERSAGAWLIALRGAQPAPEDQVAFEALIADIEAFQAWAKAESGALDRLAIQTAIEAGLDELMASDPDTAARLAHYFRKRPGSGE